MINKPYKTEAIVYPAVNGDPEYHLINGYYYEAHWVQIPTAKAIIGANYLTKTFNTNGGTTKISLSDGRTYYHPFPATPDTLVFCLPSKEFIPISKFDEMVEEIPLEGVHDV